MSAAKRDSWISQHEDKAEADETMVSLAATLRAKGKTGTFGVKVERHQGAWWVVLYRYSSE